MATSGLYGTSVTGTVQAVPGTESNGLYGNTINYGGTYFEWFIFQESATQPATPTGGSWSFGTNTGTPPSGWSLLPPSAPTNQVWVSIALVNSRSTTSLTWTTPGLFGVVPNFTFPTPITGAAGTNAAVVNLGTATNPSLQFTIPRGDTGATGPQGPQGPTGTAATIAAGTTTTGAAGTSASVTNSGTSSAAVFNFTIPRGDTGATGPTGAAATIAVGTTTTTAPGTSATVTNSGTSGAAVFNFGIPKGAGVVAGGTTGQVLAKASSTDYDTTWINIVGGLNYQGSWNASTNTPTLTSSVGTNGYYYVVSVTGSTNLNGITDWVAGDWAIFNGSTWQKIDQTNLVTSVAGRTGAVVLSNTDISGLGTMSTQNSNAVAITGGTESGVTHSGDVIGTYLDHTAVSTPSYTKGRLWYDNTSNALAYYNDVSTAIVHLGQDLQVKVINNTGSTIANGSPVYITGTSSGQTYPNVALAKADVAATAAVLGLTNGPIANGAVGYVTAQGGIDGVNTGTFTVGQVLYLSPYSAGQLMNTVPPTGIAVQVGTVTYVDSSAGKIFVKQTTPLSVSAAAIVGAVAIANGGTGQTTASAGFNALSPITSTGDLIIGNGANSATRLAIGANGYILTSNGTTATWTAAPATGVTSFSAGTTGLTPNTSTTGAVTLAGTLAIANGGTGQTTATAAFNALAPSQTGNSGKFLTTDGTNTSWSTVVGGVSQIVAGTNVTISPSGGTGVVTINATGSSNSYTRTSFTATAGQTSFTVSYTVGYVEVYLNGVFLNGTDYTATSGTAVVLAVAAAAGDIVETIAYSTNAIGTVAASNVTGTLGISQGGTGQTTAAAALNALGGASTGKAIAMAIVFGG
jgi:collagen type VII alpha